MVAVVSGCDGIRTVMPSAYVAQIDGKSSLGAYIAPIGACTYISFHVSWQIDAARSVSSAPQRRQNVRIADDDTFCEKRKQSMTRWHRVLTCMTNRDVFVAKTTNCECNTEKVGLKPESTRVRTEEIVT